MPFSEKGRLWYLRAWGGGEVSNTRCQFRLYSEEKGFYLACDQRGPSLFVSRWTLQEWGTVGIPFCRRHFMELSGLTPFAKDAVVYPELAQAFRDYRQNSNSFDDIKPFSPSHRTRIGDWGFDLYYFHYAQSVVFRYAATHLNDRSPPATRGHHYPSWSEWTETSDQL